VEKIIGVGITYPASASYEPACGGAARMKAVSWR